MTTGPSVTAYGSHLQANKGDKEEEEGAQNTREVKPSKSVPENLQGQWQETKVRHVGWGQVMTTFTIQQNCHNISVTLKGRL